MRSYKGPKTDAPEDFKFEVGRQFREIESALKRLGENKAPDMSGTPVSSGSGTDDHGALTGLGDDDHSQYALLAGRSPNQTLIGSSVGTGNLYVQGAAVTGTGGTIVMQGVNSHTGLTDILQVKTDDGVQALVVTSKGRVKMGGPANGNSSSLRPTLEVNGGSSSDPSISCGNGTTGYLDFWKAGSVPSVISDSDGIYVEGAGLYFTSWNFGYGAGSSGTNIFGNLRLLSTAQNYIGLIAPNATVSHNLTLPAAQGAANSLLMNDGSGALSWSQAITKSDLTAQTNSLAAQTMLTGGAATAGMYRISVYVRTTTAGSGGDAMDVSLTWNDGAAHTDIIWPGHDLGTLNAYTQTTFVVNSAASQNITYTTTVTKAGSPQYEIHVRCEPLL